MNTNAEMAINVIEALKGSVIDIHVIVCESSPHQSDMVALIPTDNGTRVDSKKISMFPRIPIKDFFNDIKCINAGITSTTVSEERKLYFATETPSMIGDHEWAYSSPLSDLSRLKNFCKVCFNTSEFIYVLYVDSIYDQDDIIKRIKQLIG